MGQSDRASYDIVRDYWRGRRGAKDFDAEWRRALHDGFFADSAAAPKTVRLRAGADFASQEAASESASSTPDENTFEFIFRPDPTISDGRFANNGWLPELPKPLTKLTWDNAILISPRTAAKLGIAYKIGGTGG